MKECEMLGVGSKHILTPSYIFSGVKTPNPQDQHPSCLWLYQQQLPVTVMSAADVHDRRDLHVLCITPIIVSVYTE